MRISNACPSPLLAAKTSTASSSCPAMFCRGPAANGGDAGLRFSASEPCIRANCVAVAMMSPFLSLLAIGPDGQFHAARRPTDVFIFWWSNQPLALASFSRDPLAHVSWAILELDVVGFAPSEKTDSVLIHPS